MIKSWPRQAEDTILLTGRAVKRYLNGADRSNRHSALVIALVHQALERVAVGLAGADTQRMVDRGHEDLAVADLPGARVRGDDGNRLVRKVRGDRDFDAQLGQKIHDIFGAAIDLGVALLAAIALDLGNRHAVHTDGRQRLADLVKLEGVDDRDDEFHGKAFVFAGMTQTRRRQRRRPFKSGIFPGKWHKKLAAKKENLSAVSPPSLYRRADRPSKWVPRRQCHWAARKGRLTRNIRGVSRCRAGPGFMHRKASNRGLIRKPSFAT